MGYTHYWLRTRSFERAQFEKVKTDFKNALPAVMRLGIPLAGPTGDGDPILDGEVLAFNGVRRGDGDCSFESFDLPRDAELSTWQKPDEHGRYVAFCKTAYRPYDLAVQVCLVIAAHHLGAMIAVSSDGSIEGWQKAIDLCKEELGYGGDFQLT